MGSKGEDLCEDIGDVVAARDEHERDDLVCDLFAQPRHLNTEVPVAARDNVVGHHRHARLVILKQLGGLQLRKAQLCQKVSKPE